MIVLKKPEITDIAFDNPFGRMANKLDPYTEGAKVGVMVTLISAFSAYIGHDVTIETDEGTPPLSAWFVLVGYSGIGAKGKTAGIAMPVVNKAFGKWAQNNVVRGVSATGLGLMKKLESHEGRPIFILESEGDVFIDKSKKDRSLGDRFRKIWDGETVTHQTSQVDIKVENPHLGFVIHVQPKNWGAISGTSQATGGTYNRFLPVYVERSKRVRVFGGKKKQRMEAIKEVAKDLRNAARQATEIMTAKVDDEVGERFEEHHRPICEGLTEGNEELSEMSQRALGYLIRLGALYALADGREEVSERDFDSALELIRYSVESVRCILPNTGGSSVAAGILDAVQDGPILKSELWNIFGRTKYRSHHFDEALKQLPQVHEWKLRSTGGRKATVLFTLDQVDIVRDEFDVEDGFEDFVCGLLDEAGMEGEGIEAEEMQAVSG